MKTESENSLIKGYHIRQLCMYLKGLTHLNISKFSFILENIKADFKSIEKFKKLNFLEANESLALKSLEIKELQNRGILLRGIKLKRREKRDKAPPKEKISNPIVVESKNDS